MFGIKSAITKCIEFLEIENELHYQSRKKAVQDLQKALAKVQSNTDIKHIFDFSINKLIDIKFLSKLDQNMNVITIEKQ